MIRFYDDDDDEDYFEDPEAGPMVVWLDTNTHRVSRSRIKLHNIKRK